MTTAQDIRKRFLNAMPRILDDPLKEFGFTRKESTLSYERIFYDAKQSIIFVVDYFPKYQPGAEAHVHPMIQLAMPQVSARALALVNGDKLLLAGAPEIIVNQPIEFTAPKRERQRWFATGNEEVAIACIAIKDFLLRWVLPFLSEASSAADLVKFYETNDDRIMKLQHWYIFVAAAYQLLGYSDKARDVILLRLGRPGLRARYAPVFASLGIE